MPPRKASGDWQPDMAMPSALAGDEDDPYPYSEADVAYDQETSPAPETCTRVNHASPDPAVKKPKPPGHFAAGHRAPRRT